MKKRKIYITPVFEDDENNISFKLNSNFDISGIQFTLSGFRDGSFYQFADIGTLTNRNNKKSKTKYKWREKSIMEVYDFMVSVNSHNGNIMAVSFNNNTIRSGHSHLFTIPVVKNIDCRKFKKYCIRDLVVSDRNGNNLVEGLKNVGRCIHSFNQNDLIKNSLTDIENL